MAEVPVGYFPDIAITYPIDGQYISQFVNEVGTALNLREQRRNVAGRQRVWAATSASLEQADRQRVQTFLEARKGTLDSFYFFRRDPARFNDAACGTVTADSVAILPFKDSTIYDVRVANVPKAFTTRKLTPRLGTFVAPRFYNAKQSYIDCGTNASLRSNDFTIAFWIRPITSAVDQYVVMNEVFSASGAAVILSGAAHLTLIARTNQAGASTSSVGPTLVADTWQHVGVVKSGTACTFYVNGVASAGAGTLTNPVVTAAPWRISFPNVNAFDGMLSDMRFYNTGLTAPTIANIYSLGDIGGIGTANLTGWWKLEEGTGTTAADSSGSGNTGTLSGTTANPSWVGGEDEVTFNAGAQNGAVTAWLTARERLIARSMTDKIKQTFMPNAGDVRAIYDINILELPF
jgi:hypothetical protein